MTSNSCSIPQAMILFVILATPDPFLFAQQATLKRESLGASWYEIKSRFDLKEDVPSNRRLDRADAQLLIEMSDFLLDIHNDWVERIDAARILGRLGHRQGIGALAAVLRDESDNSEVRQACAEALGGINDLKVVDILISQLDDAGESLWYYCHHTLKAVRGYQTDPRPKIPEYPKTAEARQAYQIVWRKWWSTHRTTVPQDSLRKMYLEYQSGSGWPVNSHGPRD